MKVATYIYFFKPVGKQGPIKIGCSETPPSRLQLFAAWSPVPLVMIGTVPGCIKDEQFLHRCFANSHSHGEWFRATPDVVETIKRIIEAADFEKVRPTLTEKGSVRKKRKPQSPEWRACRSYVCRVEWAQRKLRKLDENGAWHAPDDVSEILYRWERHVRIYNRGGGRVPTPAEMARLDAHVANPSADSVIPSWRRTKEAA